MFRLNAVLRHRQECKAAHHRYSLLPERLIVTHRTATLLWTARRVLWRNPPDEPARRVVMLSTALRFLKHRTFVMSTALCRYRQCKFAQCNGLSGTLPCPQNQTSAMSAALPHLSHCKLVTSRNLCGLHHCGVLLARIIQNSRTLTTAMMRKSQAHLFLAARSRKTMSRSRCGTSSNTLLSRSKAHPLRAPPAA